MFGSRRLPISIEQLDEALVEASTPELLEHLDEGSQGLRVAAACALALRRDPRGLDALLEGLGRKGLRYAALEALRHLRDPRAREPVLKVFGKRFLPHFDRTQAAGALAALGEETGRRHLLDKLERTRFEMDRGLAVELVAELDLQDAAPALERLAEDPADLFRGAALKALARLQPLVWRPRLLAILEDAEEDPDVRADAAEALAPLGGADVEAALRRAAGSEAPELAEAARALLPDA